MKMKKLLVMILALAMALSVSLVPAFAEENEPYQFKVTVYGGASGSGGTSELVDAGSSFSFPRSAITVNDDRYVCYGFREAGVDNSSSDISESVYCSGDLSVVVDHDMTFVAAYATEESLSHYTVVCHFTDGGRADYSSTYSGIIGSRIGISALFFNGYVPEAISYSTTFTADGQVITINYNAAPAVQNNQAANNNADNNAANADNGNNAAANAGNDNTAANADNGTEAGNDNTAENAADNEETAVEETETPRAATEEDYSELPEEEQPEDYINLDEDAVPQADSAAGSNVVSGSEDGVGFGVIGIVSAVVGVAAIAAIIAVLVSKRKSR